MQYKGKHVNAKDYICKLDWALHCHIQYCKHTEKKLIKDNIKFVFTKLSWQYFTLSFNIKMYIKYHPIYKNIDIY